MKVTRHYFVSDSLDDLNRLTQDLTQRDVDPIQTHVLSLDDTGAENQLNLQDVTSIMKKDVIRSGEWGLGVGVVAAAVVLILAYLSGWTASTAGWIPFIFLAIVILGFCTWEGGFVGIQRKNKNFARFEEELNQGRHVFFVDLLPNQQSTLDELTGQYPNLQAAGTERGTPQWIMKGSKEIPHFLRETLP